MNNRIDRDTSDHKYFTMWPHIVLAYARDSYDFTLWNVVKTIAGEHGECILSTEDLARLCGCSAGKISDARAYLLEARLLEGACRRDPGYPQPVWHLWIPDLWPRNIHWREEIGTTLRDLITAVQTTRAAQKNLHLVKAAPEEPSPGEEGPPPGESTANLHEKRPSPDEGQPSPGEAIKEVPQEVLNVKQIRAELNNLTPKEIWDIALTQLRLQMTQSTYQTWLHGTTVHGYTAPDQAVIMFDIAVTNGHARDWLSLRLRPTIKRTLAAIIGRAVEVTFTVTTPPLTTQLQES